MKRFLNNTLAAVLFCGLLTLTGCKATLEKGGAYAPASTNIVNGATNVVATTAPDMALYTADGAFAFAHDGYDVIVNLERNNRALFWKIAPQIKHALDSTKDEAWVANLTYTAARSAYLANPTPAGLSALQTALSKMQSALAAAQAASATMNTINITNSVAKGN